MSACDMGETGLAGAAPDFVGAVALTGQATAGVAWWMDGWDELMDCEGGQKECAWWSEGSGETEGSADVVEMFCPSGQMRVSRICRLVDWEIFVIGVGCANRHFILWRIRGKSPDGANADEPHLSADWLESVRLRGREDGLKGAAAVGVGCPAGQGQTRARRVCWLNVLSGAEGSSGVAGRFCPSGQARLGRAWRRVGLTVAMEASGVCVAVAAGGRRRDDFRLFGGRRDAAGGWLAQVSAAAGAWEETGIADTVERTDARERRLCGEVGDFCGAFLIIKRG